MLKYCGNAASTKKLSLRWIGAGGFRSYYVITIEFATINSHGYNCAIEVDQKKGRDPPES